MANEKRAGIAASDIALILRALATGLDHIEGDLIPAELNGTKLSVTMPLSINYSPAGLSISNATFIFDVVNKSDTAST